MSAMWWRLYLKDAQFEFFRLRFHFRAVDPLAFPPGKTANIVRGTLGCVLRQAACRCGTSAAHSPACSYARIFEPRPRAASGPSGFAERPRPFVLRTRHLDGQMFLPPKPFSFDVHLFDLRDPGLAHFVAGLSLLAQQGLGPGRGRAQLTSVDQLDTCDCVRGQVWDGRKLATLDAPVSIALKPDGAPTNVLRIRFVTPTELKCGGLLAARPDFSALFARIRDRLSTLCAFYGTGPLDIDFGAMGQRAAAIEMPRCDIEAASVKRRSSRTGQVHPLGGFVGEAEYRGDLAEFLPYLRAARWTGVGRQTVWGKGEIELVEKFSAERPV